MSPLLTIQLPRSNPSSTSLHPLIDPHTNQGGTPYIQVLSQFKGVGWKEEGLRVLAVFEALDVSADHIQASEVVETFLEVAFRGSSFETNRSSSVIRAVRVLHNNAWGVSSSSPPCSFKKLAEEAVKQAKLAGEVAVKRVEISEAKLAEGSFEFKHKGFDVDEVKEMLSDLAGLIAEKVGEAFIEAVFTQNKVRRRIITSDGGDAVETRLFSDLAVSVAKSFVASTQLGFDRAIEVGELVEGVVEKLRGMEEAKTLNPLMRGIKVPIILRGEAACAFIHEVVHGLEADIIAEKGRTILDGSEELTIFDDPTEGFGGYGFDDECVLARRKPLVKSGVVVNYLHTRQTAKIWGEEPKGNGRGLYTIPKALASNIIVYPGSWEFEEMVEETREGFIVDGLVKAEVQGETVSVYPELAWYVKKGEVRCPTLIRSVKIGLRNSLICVRGVGLKQHERIGYEKSFGVSEKTPPILVESARVS